MEFSPLSPHLWYLQALVYVLVIAFYCRTFRLKKACISGNSGTVGRKPDKGKLFSAPSGKRLLPCLLCEIFLYCGLPFFWLGCLFGEKKRSSWRLSGQKKNDIAFGRYSGFSGTLAVMEQRWLENECSWNRRRVCQEPFFWQSVSSFFL